MRKPRDGGGPVSVDAPSAPLSLSDAYSSIRRWCQGNLKKVDRRNDDYGKRAAALVRALPPAEHLYDLEIRAVFLEVKSGLLEWA